MQQLIETGSLELVNCLKGEETIISGSEKVRRLEKGVQEGMYVLLGPDDLRLLMEDDSRIPVSWKNRIDGKTARIYFHSKTKMDETTGEERYRFLCWSGTRWQIGADTVDGMQGAHTPSAVIRQMGDPGKAGSSALTLK